MKLGNKLCSIPVHARALFKSIVQNCSRQWCGDVKSDARDQNWVDVIRKFANLKCPSPSFHVVVSMDATPERSSSSSGQSAQDQ